MSSHPYADQHPEQRSDRSPEPQPGLHPDFQHLIDELLTARNTAGSENAETVVTSQAASRLREHLQTCAACRDYLDTGMRAVAALNGFSFPVDPALPGRITASIRQRAQQLDATRLSARTIALASVAALALTAAGSFVDLRLSGLLATVLEVQRAQVQQGLLTFWIGPSLCLLLVFPMLPLLWRRNGGLL